MRRLVLLLVSLAGGAALGLVLLSINRCPPPNATLSTPAVTASSTGPLQVGAARTAFQLSPQVTLAGFGPPRASVSTADHRLGARATVLQVGQQRFGLVLLDLLFIPSSVVSRIRGAFDFPIWVAATHTHSGPGQFDQRLVSQVAALGRFEPRVEAALVESAQQAVSAASRALAPAQASLTLTDSRALAIARSGSDLDTSVTQIEFRRASGQAVLARWVVTSAHPTLTPRSNLALSGDYPLVEDNADTGVTMVFQGSAGNATASGETVGRQQHNLLTTLAQTPAVPLSIASLELSTSGVLLPPVDASRLVPALLQPALRNVLCRDMSEKAEVSRLQLGSFSVLALPFEPSAESGAKLKAKSKAQALISLANGYFGYLEPEATVSKNEGESKRQYFDASLQQRLEEAVLPLSLTKEPTP